MNEKRYWFPAKRYGWGWGLPSTWQGWLVLAGYIVLMFVGRLMFQSFEKSLENTIGFVAYVVVLSVVLVAICYAKGEPPKWRWGRR